MKVILGIQSLNSALKLSLALATFTVHGSGIPEPGLIIYGVIQDSAGKPSLPAFSPSWRVETTQESAMVSSALVVINGNVYYVANVPFETRQIGDSINFNATLGKLDLKRSPSSYRRSAWVGNNRLDFEDDSQEDFTFSIVDRGRVDRVDLRLQGAEPNVDSDGDGMPDWAEAIAGTNSNDPVSVLRFSSDVRRSPSGGLTLNWSSIVGKRYSVLCTKDLALPLAPLTTGLQATGTTTSFTDDQATGAGPYFYRIQIEKGPDSSN